MPEPTSSKQKMRKIIIKHIKEISNQFIANELAFYCFTNSFESTLRDKLAWRLQSAYDKKYTIQREWKKVDISIHKRNEVRSLIEIKYSRASLIVRKENKKEIRILKSLKKQYNKDKEICNNWYGIVFLSCPQSKVPEKYLNQVKIIRAINKHVNDYSSARGWRQAIEEAITLHFPENKFSVTSNFLHAGCWFKTNVNLLWFLISRRP
ncbi:hypothetical protein MEO93_28590 [Dolichospermum sp. ST_sed3]|nr:hypothetical protein [Dolichospermum sp. ST_sed3]